MLRQCYLYITVPTGKIFLGVIPKECLVDTNFRIVSELYLYKYCGVPGPSCICVLYFNFAQFTCLIDVLDIAKGWDVVVCAVGRWPLLQTLVLWHATVVYESMKQLGKVSQKFHTTLKQGLAGLVYKMRLVFA